MRKPYSLLWRLSFGILAVLAVLCSLTPVTADTGTYRLSDYIVTLEPQSDGQTRITIEQTWVVTGGNIPWVTVGLPNNNFSILDFSGAAVKVKPDSQGSFTGVQVDLDKKYLPGESFGFKFSILQNNLLERLPSQNSWRIIYTPGWYDRATIESLRVILVSPVDLSSYTTLSPAPYSQENKTIVWQSNKLAPGEKLKIALQSTDGSFLSAGVANESSQNQIKKGFGPAFFIVIGVILLIGFLIFLVARRYKQQQEADLHRRVERYEKEMAENKTRQVEIEEGFKQYVEAKKLAPDAEGRYYDQSYGSYITPAIWAAVILYQNQQHIQAADGNTVPPPNNPPSCACVACACACACACAGGGAAGCARKTIHECPDCRELNEKEHASFEKDRS